MGINFRKQTKFKNSFSVFREIVNVILNDPALIPWNIRLFISFAWRVIKYELDVYGFVFINCLFSFLVSLQTWHAHFLLQKQWIHYQKNRYLPHYWSEVSWVPLWINRAMSLFNWRVTINYEDDPINKYVYSTQKTNRCLEHLGETY